MAATQQYCLRWNNHRSNLLTVFDELLRNEAFTDVTLACEGGGTIRCHRVVLAACSPYFQSLFMGFPCKHPIVIIKDVKYSEIKAILEYMYRGEVNVAQDQLAALLKIAEALKVKGLVEENKSSRDRHPREDEHPMDHCPSVSTSNSTMLNTVHSSSSNTSPPHSTYKSPYNPYNNKPQDPRLNLPMWTVPGLPLPLHSASVPNPNHQTNSSLLTSCYDVASSDMSPLRIKKLTSLAMNRDTPILRTVLAQTQADSSQPVRLMCHSDNGDHLNGSDDRLLKHMKNEPSEDAQSPYTIFTPMNDEEDKSKPPIPSSPPQSFTNDMRSVPYIPPQKHDPSKRYKKYSRDDIMSAIYAVKKGTSALKAAELYNVPSRTLYDKVKKMGIITRRPPKRVANGRSNCFSYGGHLSESDERSMNNNSTLIEANTFLQHSGRGDDERDSLSTMAAAAAAHTVASGHSTSPNDNGRARSPSPSPTMLKYMQYVNMSPSPAPGSDQHHSHSETNCSSERDHEDDEDQVEDLSINRKESLESTGVITSPITNISDIMKKEELLIDSLKEEARRASLECEGE